MGKFEENDLTVDDMTFLIEGIDDDADQYK